MKRSGIAALRRSGVLRIARALQRDRSTILTYHGVLSGDDDAYDFLNHNFVAAGAFERHIKHLLRHYRPIRLADLVRCYRENTPPPRHAIALTFDDGFANNYTVAFPILKKYSFPFTVFLTTGLLDAPGAQLWTERVKRAVYLCPRTSVPLRLFERDVPCRLESAAAREEATGRILRMLKRLQPAQRDAAVSIVEATCGRPEIQAHELERYQFLTWAQVRAMASAGVEFGSHTVHHPILSTLDDRLLRAELVESKERIESELGGECYAFAYPNGQQGDFGPREKLAVAETGYQCALSLGGTLNARRPDLFQFDRINIGRQFDDALIEAAVTGVLGRVQRAREALRDVGRPRATPSLEQVRLC